MEVPAKGNVLGRIIPARYIFAILSSIGMAIVYGLKVNLSVAMVGMLNHTAIKQMTSYEYEEDVIINFTTPAPVTNDAKDCQATASNKTADELDGPFVWPSEVQGIILSSYFWGYMVSQIPGGRLAELFSAKWVMFFSVAINVVCTLLTPIMAEVHYSAAVIMRVGEGIGGGVTFPAMHVLLSKWAPPAERSVMASLVYAGTSLGTVLSLLMAGGLTAVFGWKSVFYVMGIISSIWCILWMYLVQDSPQKQPFISIEERKMIISSLGETHNDSSTKYHHKPSLPLRAVLQSPAFLAILVAHVCNNWGYMLLLVNLPFFMKHVLKFNMTENTLTTALPFLSMWLFSIALSSALDSLRGKKIITTTTARRIGTLVSSAGPATCMLVLCYVGCNRVVGVALMTIAVTSIGGIFSGFVTNHIDIAPNFAGTLMAITNTAATIPAIIVPIFVGAMTRTNQSIAEWRIIFFVTIGLYIIEIVVYSLFSSGEEQPWNNISDQCLNQETKPLNEKKKDIIA